MGEAVDAAGFGLLPRTKRAVTTSCAAPAARHPRAESATGKLRARAAQAPGVGPVSIHHPAPAPVDVCEYWCHPGTGGQGVRARPGSRCGVSPDGRVHA
ncbi:hypothetical protein GCM10012287_14690 [Streptomyces daqingensis]|uniref:Uncharacterized protein n=1 Tax=Streptomyces daqingensis TaxID=1472640 RepID=A0ABQ2M228_9ACTN|nr:hypothetical protein GCM10012287_14690 [Streptomyces daqingensis]